LHVSRFISPVLKLLSLALRNEESEICLLDVIKTKGYSERAWSSPIRPSGPGLFFERKDGTLTVIAPSTPRLFRLKQQSLLFFVSFFYFGGVPSQLGSL